MTSTKSFLASTTIWGGLVAMTAAGLGFLGYTFGVEDQAQVVEWATGLAGGLIAIVGRVRASKRIA